MTDYTPPVVDIGTPSNGDRFDIDGPARKHLITVNGLLKEPASQMDLGQAFRYDHVSDLIKKYSCQVEEDLIQLLKLMLFNRAINNTDDHERNFSLMHSEQGYHLAPAYDLVPSLTTNMHHAASYQYQAYPPTPTEALSEGRIFKLPRSKVEKAALVFATLGWVGAGWASGLSTFCAYNKGHDVVFWEECYKVSWAFTGESSQPFGNGLPTKLPVKYFTLLLLAVLCALVGPVLWFVLWKVIRQIVRPARAQYRRANGLRELPQTAMFGLAFSVGIISGSGAWVFRQMIGLVHNALFLQKDLVTSNATHYNANVHTPPAEFMRRATMVFWRVDAVIRVNATHNATHFGMVWSYTVEPPPPPASARSTARKRAAVLA